MLSSVYNSMTNFDEQADTEADHAKELFNIRCFNLNTFLSCTKRNENSTYIAVILYKSKRLVLNQPLL